MAEIVNLRMARKGKARRDRAAEADANRLAFGRSKAERQETALGRADAERRLDGHRLDGRRREGPDENADI